MLDSTDKGATMGKVVEGVFVGDKPLAEYLEDQERDEKSKAVEDIHRKATMRHTKKIAVKGHKVESKRVVSTKVWTDDEIRQRRGLMSKPFKNNMDNAIWVICEKGPVNTKGIMKEMGFPGPYNSASAMVATIWKRLGNKHEFSANLLVRFKRHKTWVYEPRKGLLETLTPEMLIAAYKDVATKQNKAYLDKKRKAAEPKQLPLKLDDGPTEEPELDIEETRGAQAEVESVIEKVIKQALGVDVTVTGRVEIVFKLGGY